MNIKKRKEKKKKQNPSKRRAKKKKTYCLHRKEMADVCVCVFWQ
jgi:hypothetical protein